MKILNNGLAVLENDECISKWVEEAGRLDHDQSLLPKILAHIKKGDIVVDAGAYIGDHTAAYAEAVGPRGHVIAFEPSRSAYECLSKNTLHLKNVTRFNCALSGMDSMLSLAVNQTNPGANRAVCQPNGGPFQRTRGATLDSFGIVPKLIKADVEGWECKLLRGASETIRKARPILVLEVNDGALREAGDSQDALFQQLRDMDYSFGNAYPGELMDGPQFDIICHPQ